MGVITLRQLKSIRKRMRKFTMKKSEQNRFARMFQDAMLSGIDVWSIPHNGFVDTQTKTVLVIGEHQFDRDVYLKTITLPKNKMYPLPLRLGYGVPYDEYVEQKRKNDDEQNIISNT